MCVVCGGVGILARLAGFVCVSFVLDPALELSIEILFNTK